MVCAGLWHLHPVLHISEQTLYLCGPTGAGSLRLPSVLKFTGPCSSGVTGKALQGLQRRPVSVCPLLARPSRHDSPWLCSRCRNRAGRAGAVWAGGTVATTRAMTPSLFLLQGNAQGNVRRFRARALPFPRPSPPTPACRVFIFPLRAVIGS